MEPSLRGAGFESDVFVLHNKENKSAEKQTEMFGFDGAEMI